MGNLYEYIERLAKSKGFKNITEFCRVADIPRATMSELKAGRTKRLSAETLSKIAAHLNVPVDYLLGSQSNEWCERFRSQLATVLTDSNHDDIIATGIDFAALWRIAEGETNLSFDRACDIADALGVSIDFMIGKEKTPTDNGERDILDEVDVAFYGDFKELNEDEKETVRDMVRLMRQRKEKRSQ